MWERSVLSLVLWSFIALAPGDAHAANAVPLGVEIGVATQSEVRAKLGKATSLADGGVNKFTDGKMLMGEVSWRHLSGPVTIADFAGQSAQMGWISYVTFLALISISLGVLNLLPVPLLDGGHLMYYLAEIVKGGPVPDRVIEVGQRIGMAVLAMLMALALFNDLSRLF